MSGTIKHFIDGGTYFGGGINHNERVCDTITDRHGNQTVLSYAATATNSPKDTHFVAGGF
jgi:hypothetical protein